MADYISNSACRGIKPNKLVLNNKKVRERLISKLMSQRSVLRFISAPNGFGKSTLCGQYANLVFSFKDVFWIDCKSPCFIRDLDSEEILSQIIQICDYPKLVVFDNISVFDEDRASRFSLLIDNLLEIKCEVIVNTIPFNETLLRWQTDAYILRSEDLLVRDCGSDCFDSNTIKIIPVVYWNNSKDVLSIINCAIKENFPDPIIFSLFYIYLFQNGSLDELKAFLTNSQIKLLKEFNNKYLYFGINNSKNSFSVPKVNISKFLSIFNSKFDALLNVMSCTDRSDFTEKLSLLLEKRNKNKTLACVANYYPNKPLRKHCLEKLNEDSLKNFYISTMCELYEKIDIPKSNDGFLTSFQSFRLAILGHKDEAIKYAYSVLDNKSAHIDNKLLAALIFVRFGSNYEVKQAMKIIRYLNNDFKIKSYLNKKNINDAEKFKCRAIWKLIAISFSIFTNNKNPFSVWLSLVDEKINATDLLSAELLLNFCLDVNPDFFKTEDFDKFINILNKHYEFLSKSSFDFYSFFFLNTYMNTTDMLSTYNCDSSLIINENTENFYEEKKLLLEKQIKAFDINLNLKKIRKFNGNSLWENINKKNISNSEYLNNIPKLKINIFGGLSAYIGDKEITDRNFGRKNVKILCCILAIENGNEIGKSQLAQIIWPDTDEESRRINMNALWSVFRKIFTMPNGECPYLIKNQNSYKFAVRYLETDVQKLVRVCSDVTLGNTDSQSLWNFISNNENIICGDLLPSEISNAYINQKRKDYINIVVNALIAGSNRFAEAGNAQQALWLSQKALERNNTREDVYLSLMKAQYMAGQRTSAIETYFACEKFLNTELGIKPSKTLKNLYDDVVSEAEI